MSSYSKWLLFLKKILVGLRALTVQNYTEANIKNGLQFEASRKITSVAAGASHNISFVTGAKPVIIKTRHMEFDSSELQLNRFRAPTGVTGGTPVVPSNPNDINPQASTVTITDGVSVTGAGVSWGPGVTMLGSTEVGNAKQSTPRDEGFELILRPNTSYLFRSTNTDTTNPTRLSWYFTWYEGEPDLPADEGEL